MSDRGDRTERLLNVLIALRSTSTWISRAQLRESIDGYRELSDQAFDRQFSRDKKTLRDLGVNILTREHDDFFGEDESDSGYRIADSGYELPPLSFTPAEAAVIAAAAGIWRQAALGQHAERALTKLKALGVEFSAEALGGITMFGHQPEPSFTPVYEAVRDGQAIGFSYRKPRQGPQPRRVEPWGLLTRRGTSYLYGRDLDRQAPRLFRLDRIAGTVKPLPGRRGGDYERPEQIDFRALLPRMQAEEEQSRAVLRLAPGRGAALRRRGTVQPDDPDVVRLGYRDETAFAAELAAYGADVRVLEPETLRDALDRHLAAVERRLAALVEGEEPAR
ncbi:helix-turn-helix transcriptional regulator [Sediminivirga luteola]|uniref:WYL domain-containing protein n=1 Tax=Sediminivirga luteola TaxID=1774748 RepID=A0A8J2XLJ1_9MICO|nr:WYL domain-containing protein [Sediminivirga luteola]MCI2264057.1 WYL domain-containing protein [Sediminivirga luteola]GGA22699.1 WYL domain-containing protein [Sediminivirga luteola]